MATIIQNPSIEPTTLPYPLAGVLAGLQSIVLSADYADVVAAIGSETVEKRALLVSESSSSGPFDDAQYGGALLNVIDYTLSASLPFAIQTTDAMTDDALSYAGGTGGFVAPKAGFVSAFSAALTAAAADDDITVSVFVNGVLAADSTLTFADGGDTTASVLLLNGEIPVSPGDLITVAYTSGAGLSNTPELTATVLVSM